MAQVVFLQIQERLEGTDYPASKQDLMEHARKGIRQDDEVTKALSQLPDKIYLSQTEVIKEIGDVDDHMARL
ncbi:hypothetical protein GCM10028895_49260 [Pontibacter rugosus]